MYDLNLFFSIYVLINVLHSLTNSLKNISDDEDRGIANIPTPGDNMADDGGAVSSETTEMKTPNKELSQYSTQ